MKKKTIDQIAAEELKLYADNSYRVYKNIYLPICENLKRKVNKKTFDCEKAVNAFMYCADFAAKLYHSEFGGKSIPWYQVFNKETRQAVAEDMVSDFISENM